MSVLLKGITWSHSRGYTSITAVSQRFCELTPRVSIEWEKRSLQEFADAPIENLAKAYDLLIIDHPWAGFAAATGILLPLNEYLPAAYLADQEANSVGKSHISYNFNGFQSALAIDAATPIAVYRPDYFADRGLTLPADFEDVVELANTGCVAFAGIPLNLLMDFYMYCATTTSHFFEDEDNIVDRAVGVEVLENMRRLVEDNVSDFGGDFRRRFGDEYRWVNVRLLFDPSLRQNEAILCFRLVDQEKSSQLQHLRMLEEALDDVRESEASQEKFFSQMSHDMRTPLSVIMASVELARQQEGDWARTDDYLRKIQVSADQLMRLINSILEMSRMEKTELILSNDPCDLRGMVSECLSPFQAQADLQHKTLEVTFDLRHPRVYVDTFRLQQILNNLVSNAMKFTREGDSVRVEVTQSDWQEEEICRIVVQDTGVGISPECPSCSPPMPGRTGSAPRQ